MHVGIDLGGTHIAVGLVDEQGLILEQTSRDTLPYRGPQALVDDMISMIHSLLDRVNVKPLDLESIGVGVPGQIHPDGIVAECVNLGWHDVPLKEMLSKSFSCPIYLSNDASAATLAEHVIGSLSGAENAVMLTLGTGIGSGIICDGKLLKGRSELGHMVISDSNECTCGRTGCLETYASASALIREAQHLILLGQIQSSMAEDYSGSINAITGKAVFDYALEGDLIALEAVDHLAFYLAKGIVNIINILDPEVITLGGGLSKSGEFLIDFLLLHLEAERNFRGLAMPQIRLAALGSDAGIIGAALLHKYQ